jgi:hypothetical protein
MERTSALIAIISAVLAGLVIYYCRPLGKKVANWIRNPAASRFVAVGTLENTVGQVRIISANESDAHIAQIGVALRHLDTLLVDGDSEATLSFNSGYRLKILANSEIGIQSYRPEKAKSPILVTLMNGDFQTLSRGVPGDLFVASRNQIFAPEYRPQLGAREMLADRDRQTPAEIAALAEPAKTTPLYSVGSTGARHEPPSDDAIPDKVLVHGHETLSSRYIERTIEAQTGAFRRCQLNSVRDNLTAEGSLLFSITISPSGHIDHLQVTQDQLKNDQLLSCTRSVIERLQFKSFAGEPVTVSYPVEFR